jgi:O-antigen/teichoic acid export membrane protein
VSLRTENLPRAGLISMVGSGVSAAAAMLLTIIVGRSLSASGTGLFFQAIGLFTIASQVLRFGTATGLTRSMASQQVRNVSGAQLRTLLIAVVPCAVLAVVTSIGIWIFADPLSRLLGSSGEEESLAQSLRLLAPFLSIAVVLGVLQSALRLVRGVGSFTVLQNILLPVSRLVGVASLAAVGLQASLLGWSLPLPLWLVVTVALLWRPLARDRAMHDTATGDQERWQDFWRFSLARGLAATLEILLDWSDVLIVAALTTPSTAGVYAVVTRIVRAGQIVDRSVRVALSPRIAAMLAKGEHGATSELHSGVARLMVLTAWPFYLTLVVMGEAVLRLFGSEFVVGAGVLQVLALSMMVAVAAGMLQSITLQAGRSSWQVVNKSVAVSLSVVLNLLLVPRMGIAGAAVTWAIVVLVDTLLASYQVHFKLGVHLHPDRLVSAMLLSTGVFGLLGLAVRAVVGTSFGSLLVYLAVCGSTYLVLLWRFRAHFGLERVARRLLPQR